MTSHFHSSNPPTLHGRNPRDIEATAQEWLFREPETVLLDEERRIRWMCDAKRRRLGEPEAARLMGECCHDNPGVCLHACQECALEEFRVRNRPSDGLSTWHVTGHTRQPMLVHVDVADGPDGQALMRVRHIPQGVVEVEDVGERMNRHAMWASMSVLTAGLAHEMRNPLTALEMKLSALRERPAYGLTDRGKEAVNDLLGICRRMGNVIENLCAFSRPAPLRQQEIDPTAAIRRALGNRSDALKGTRVEVVSEMDGHVMADPDQLSTALGHLISNAIDAMPEGGELTITLTSLDHWCCIDVTDTGLGFLPGIRERFGQPFVTTKPPGQGAGLGLSLCQMILERHAGRLQLIEPGPGRTTVRAMLPLQTTTEGPRAS